MTLEALELVRLGLSGKKWGLNPFSQNDSKAALNVLNAVGAVELAHRSLGKLSGGELQRIFLAVALVSNPDLLLLDEPLSNLDIRRERELVQLINNVVRSRNVTALLIAHNINPLLPVLDKVIYIANGKVATGKPKEVLTSESLTALYGTPVEVLRDSRGNLVVIGVDEDQTHCVGCK
jgi:zinc/manganese transport system ATP-binding protein